MIRPLLTALGLTGLLAGFALAQHGPALRSDAAVTTQPATLPAGHPPLTGSNGLPAGHPPITNYDLPAGHPPISGDKPLTAALRVNVTQGTKNGPALGKDAVTIEIYSVGKVMKKVDSFLDAKGSVTVENIPLDHPVQPVITVHHAGADEQAIGSPITTQQPTLEMNMPVYETTDVQPAWTIGMRRVILAVNSKGLHVIETIGGYNPTDLAWLGAKTADDRETFSLGLPADATDIQLGAGLATSRGKVLDHRVVRAVPMLPGVTEYDLSYLIPVKDGAAKVTFVSPAKVSLFAVYMRAGGMTVKADGIALSKVPGIDDGGRYRVYTAKAVPAGTVITVELSDITLPPPAKTSGVALPENHP